MCLVVRERRKLRDNGGKIKDFLTRFVEESSLRKRGKGQGIYVREELLQMNESDADCDSCLDKLVTLVSELTSS